MVTFTDRAREMILSYLGQTEGELDALRIAVAGGSPLAPRFELTLVGGDDRGNGEVEVDAGGFTLLFSEDHSGQLDGAVVDFVERVNESGFEVRVPDRAATIPGEGAGPGAAPDAATGNGAGTEAPTGPIAERVRTVLDHQVNPAIAAHGGAIHLIDVQGTEVYLQMSGGCQGCALSRMTLRQGVERMLLQSVPEITAVHDVTDHASGENPYFEG